VIIPALNEAAVLPRTLEQVAQAEPHEVIVVDGGSDDGTVACAAKWARVLVAPRGRAVQQNHGARLASGEILLFLHADCWPEPGWMAAVRRAAARPGFVAGAFRMRIAGERRAYRAIERGGDLRVRWLGMPYGDQGIFLERSLFWSLGGFPEVRLMEDLQLMRRARRRGRVDLLPHRIQVHPRRWERAGVVSQTLRNWYLTALVVWAGWHPDRLDRFYPVVR
jgi:hypothetical protein